MIQSPGLHVFDVSTGAEKVIQLPPTRDGWVGIDFTARGIFLTSVDAEFRPAVQPGLLLVNPDSGAIQRLDSTQSWSQIDADAAWGIKRGPSDMELTRLDLTSGTLTTYLTVPYHSYVRSSPEPGDRYLQLIALDPQGRPLVLIRNWQQPFPWRFAIVDGQETLRDVSIPDSWSSFPLNGGDPYQLARALFGYRLSQGIWMISGTYSFPGVAFLGSDYVIRQVSTSPTGVFAIAGGCH